MKQITKDWLDASSTDIESIGCLISNERLTGHVAFHAQQAIEKALKALIEEHGDRQNRIAILIFISLQRNTIFLSRMKRIYKSKKEFIRR